MAGLIDTQLLDWRVRNANLYENEFRGTDCGALEFYVSQNRVAGGPVNAQIQAMAEGSMGNTLKFPVLKRNTSASVATTRGCVQDNHETESALVGLTWLVARDGFTMFPERYMNNEIMYQQHFDANMKDMINRLRAKLESYCISDLSTNKTQQIEDELGYTFTSSTLAVPGSSRDEFLADVTGMMRSNGYMGRIHIIGSHGIQNLVAHMGEHGTYNDVNLGMEYGDKIFHTSSHITHSNKFASFYAVEEGQVGFVTRLSREQYVGINSTLGKSWGSMVLPGTGINFGVIKTESVGDMTSYLDNSGSDMTCSRAINYLFECEIAFLDKYNSAIATYPNPIIYGQVDNFTRGVNNVAIVGDVTTKPATGAVWDTRAATAE